MGAVIFCLYSSISSAGDVKVKIYINPLEVAADRSTEAFDDTDAEVNHHYSARKKELFHALLGISILLSIRFHSARLLLLLQPSSSFV